MARAPQHPPRDLADRLEPYRDDFDRLIAQTLGTSGTALQAMADWIRANAVAYGCERVIDVNAALNPDNSGKWRTDLNSALGMPPTYDGVHPSQAMIEWVAAQGVIAPGMFTL